MSLKSQVSISGLYSPTKTNRESVCNKWGIPDFPSLDSVNFDEFNIIIVSIDKAHNQAVLKKISYRCRHCILIIDTPVIDRKRDLVITIYLRRFKNVIVTEDYIQFPQFRVMRHFLKNRPIGKILRIELKHTGFNYHALSLLRSFANFDTFADLRKTNAESSSQTVSLITKSGIKMDIIEPYKRLDGWVKIVCEKAVLIFDPEGHYKKDKNENLVSLTQNVTESNELSFSINEVEMSQGIQSNDFTFVKSLNIADTTDFNSFKTCGLIKLIKEALDENITLRYTYKEALYDSVLSKLIWERSKISKLTARLILTITKIFRFD